MRRVGIGQMDPEMMEIHGSLNTAAGKLFSRSYFKPLSIAFLVAMFNQFSGINAILYFAPRIFELSGMSENAAFFHPVIIGVTNALFTLLGLAVVDRFGRRPLLITGSVGMAACLSVVAGIYFSQSYSGLLLPALVGYIMCFAVSTGTVIWILISEVFPASVRGKGQSFGSFTHWFFAALITFLFPIISSGFRFGAAWVFVFFAAMMLLQAFVAWSFFPETKGKTLEQIGDELKSRQ